MRFDQTAVFKPALPEELLEELDVIVGALEPPADDYCPSAWSGWWPIGRDPASLAERVAQVLLERARPLAPDVAGAEWWVRVAPCSEGHDPHFDKDETAWALRGLMRHPEVGSVLYLGDAGGATVLYDLRLMTDELGKPLGCDLKREEPAKLAATPERNQYLVFPGWVFHEVLANNDPGIRRTVLFNWWAKRPKGMPSSPVRLPGE